MRAHHRGVPRPPDPPDHPVPARHRGAAGGTDAHRGRRQGHLGRVARHRSAVALADRLGTPLVGFPVTTAGSWHCRSSSAVSSTRCSLNSEAPGLGSVLKDGGDVVCRVELSGGDVHDQVVSRIVGQGQAAAVEAVKGDERR